MAWDDQLKGNAYDTSPNSNAASPGSAVSSPPAAGAPAAATSGSSDGYIVGGPSSSTPAKGALPSFTMSPTLRQAVGLDGEGLDGEELGGADGAREYTGATAADPAVLSVGTTGLGATVRSGGNVEPGAADTLDDVDELSGKATATHEAAVATELHSNASANVDSPLLSEHINDLAAASARAGFTRTVPAACITCPACNGKHRGHTCHVPPNERPQKQDRRQAQEKQPSIAAHSESTDTASALQDDASRLGRQRKRKVVWEPKPEQKRVSHNVSGAKGKPEPQQVLPKGRSGGTSSISNTVWQQPGGPRLASGGNAVRSRMASGGSGKPAPSKTANKTPPAFGPVPEICVQENVGRRIACYWDVDQVRACCCSCARALNCAALVVDGWWQHCVNLFVSACAVSAGVVHRRRSGV